MDKPVVLVVDDETNARNMLTEFLESRFDCKFREAIDGEEAVKFVKENHCDVMFLDIKMPKKDGMAVIREAKEANPKLDIIVVSGWINDDVVVDIMKMGATGYAIKPMNLKAIASLFENILQRRGQKISKI